MTFDEHLKEVKFRLDFFPMNDEDSERIYDLYVAMENLYAAVAALATDPPATPPTEKAETA